MVASLEVFSRYRYHYHPQCKALVVEKAYPSTLSLLGSSTSPAIGVGSGQIGNDLIRIRSGQIQVGNENLAL